jgi:hypothetical protein
MQYRVTIATDCGALIRCMTLLHFLTLYPLANVPLPEGRAGAVWESSKKENFCFPLYMFSLSLLSIHFLFSLNLK